MSIREAVERDLDRIRRRDPGLADSALAALALALATEVDEPGNSATSKSMNAHQLRDTLDRLRELAPEEEVGDQLDDIAKQRAKRRAGASAG